MIQEYALTVRIVISAVDDIDAREKTGEILKEISMGNIFIKAPVSYSRLKPRSL